jgi:hypothetical protein
MATQPMRNGVILKERKSQGARHEVKVRVPFIRLPRRSATTRDDGRVA